MPGIRQGNVLDKARRDGVPKEGYFKREDGRYGPIFPKTPACYGFCVIAKVIPGREEHLYKEAKVMEKAIADDPSTLAILKAHYLRWVIFTMSIVKFFREHQWTGFLEYSEHPYVSCKEIKKSA